MGWRYIHNLHGQTQNSISWPEDHHFSSPPVTEHREGEESVSAQVQTDTMHDTDGTSRLTDKEIRGEREERER